MSFGNPFKPKDNMSIPFEGPVQPGVQPLGSLSVPGYSGFGNKLSQMGGFNNILGQDERSKMSQAEINKYDKDRTSARNKGLGDLAYAVGSAFKGEDFMPEIKDRREKRSELFNRNEMARLYRTGDIEGAMALGMEMGDGTASQAAYNKYAKDQERLANRPTRTDDNMYKIDYNADGTKNLTLDQDYLDQYIEVENAKNKIESKAVKPSNSYLKEERKEIDDIRKMERNADKSVYFAEQMKAGNLDLSRSDNAADWIKDNITGNLFTSDEGQKEFMVNDEYNRFIEKLRADSLALQSGTKTDMDAKLAMDQVASARDPESFINAMRELEELNRYAANFKRSILTDNRTELGYTIPDYLKDDETDLQWKEVE
jgi:hypothetical protein